MPDSCTCLQSRSNEDGFGELFTGDTCFDCILGVSFNAIRALRGDRHCYGNELTVLRRNFPIWPLSSSLEVEKRLGFNGC